MDRSGREPRSYATGAFIDMTTVVSMVDAGRLGQALERRVGLALSPPPGAPAGRHPVIVELWRVRDGRAEAGALDQHEWSESTGGTLGGALGAQLGAALGASVGAIAGATGAGLAGAFLGPLGLFWGASTGWLTGATLGGASGAAVLGTLGESVLRETSRRVSETASRTLGTYHEVALLVPGVASRGGPPLPHAFVWGMYTDSPVAKWTADGAGYGFGKRLARITCRPFEQWVVTSLDGQPLLEARLACSLDWTVEGDAAAGAAPSCWFTRPLLGQAPDGRLVESRLDRCFDYENVLVSRAGGGLSISQGFGAALEPGSYSLRDDEAGLTTGLHVKGVFVKLTHPERFQG